MKTTRSLLLFLFMASSGAMWGQNGLQHTRSTHNADITHSPIDTLNTGKRDLKVILYDDRTWEYIGTALPEEVLLSIGDTVRAPSCGVVCYASSSFSSGSNGSWVAVRHPNGMAYYRHLSKILVDAGQMVRAGDALGLAGGTVAEVNTAQDDTVHDDTAHKDTVQKSTVQKDTARKDISSEDRVIHIVRSGDTLAKIAQTYGTTISEICRLNSIGRDDILQLDTKLIVK